ncbi:MAG: squalene/phytoene synthase family protein [Alphaproteobacteria bacterium]|nr:squalene/phytoene synthase family protein [Alphaproteobacteria bacterium]
MPDAFEHCERLVRDHDKDRFLAALFAPAKHRRALHALYAFNLEIARTRELAREPMPGELRLQWWREALGGERAADAQAHPVAAAVCDVTVRYRLPPPMLVDLIDARAFDLYDEPTARLNDLELYAVRTSSAVIELGARILADGRDPGLGDLAGHAGIAYAMAGLLRALPIHAARRQLYVPAETMARYGARAEDLFAGQTTTEWRAALAELRLRARHHLDAARRLIGDAPALSAPALLPVALVRPMLDRMERRSYRPLEPSELPQWRRQWILWRAARSGLRKAF